MKKRIISMVLAISTVLTMVTGISFASAAEAADPITKIENTAAKASADVLAPFKATYDITTLGGDKVGDYEKFTPGQPYYDTTFREDEGVENIKGWVYNTEFLAGEPLPADLETPKIVDGDKAISGKNSLQWCAFPPAFDWDFYQKQFFMYLNHEDDRIIADSEGILLSIRIPENTPKDAITLWFSFYGNNDDKNNFWKTSIVINGSADVQTILVPFSSFEAQKNSPKLTGEILSKLDICRIGFQIKSSSNDGNNGVLQIGNDVIVDNFSQYAPKKLEFGTNDPIDPKITNNLEIFDTYADTAAMAATYWNDMDFDGKAAGTSHFTATLEADAPATSKYNKKSIKMSTDAAWGYMRMSKVADEETSTLRDTLVSNEEGYFNFWAKGGVYGQEIQISIVMKDFPFTRTIRVTDQWAQYRIPLREFKNTTFVDMYEGVKNNTSWQSDAYLCNIKFDILGTGERSVWFDEFAFTGNKFVEIATPTDHLVIPKYTVTTVVDGNGTITGGGTFDELTEVVLKAIPEEGYKLSGWIIDGKKVGFKSEYSFELTGDVSITAKFIKIDNGLGDPDPEEPGNGTNGGNNGGNNSSNNGGNGTKGPQTGDTTPLALLFSLILASGTMATLFVVKKVKASK